MKINETIYQDVRKAAWRGDQDWQDKVHDAMVWLLEHDGTIINRETGQPEPVENPAALGHLYMRGKIRNESRRKQIVSLTDEANMISAERALGQFRAAEDRRQTLMDRIAELTPIEQTICRLLLTGHTQAQIAERLGMKAATLRTRLRRMRDVQ